MRLFPIGGIVRGEQNSATQTLNCIRSIARGALHRLTAIKSLVLIDKLSCRKCIAYQLSHQNTYISEPRGVKEVLNERIT
jgi:predicted transposase YbfD/YdcC